MVILPIIIVEVHQFIGLCPIPLDFWFCVWNWILITVVYRNYHTIVFIVRHGFFLCGCYFYHHIVRAEFSFDLSNLLENPEHHGPRLMGCDNLTPKNIRLSNMHQTTNPLISRPFLRSPNCVR